MKLPGVVYSSPVRFTPRQRLLLATAPPLAAAVHGAMMRTWRWEQLNRGPFDEATRNGGVVLGVWHEAFLPLVHEHVGRNTHAAASMSFDGELGARFVGHFGIEVVRGSSSRGGSEVIANLTATAGRVPCLALTMDGPRGPRRVAKPGVMILAARLQLPIFVCAFVAKRVWRLKSWDQTIIPKPFARMLCEYSDPIAPPESDDAELVEAKRVEVENRLNAMYERLERIAPQLL